MENFPCQQNLQKKQKTTWEKGKVKQKQYVENPSTSLSFLRSDGFRHRQLFSPTLTQLRTRKVFEAQAVKV
jgi:hypothetical protein